MADPLLVFLARSPERGGVMRRRAIPIPEEVPNTDAIFLVLRRMRMPLVFLVLIFAFSVLGLTLIPNADGSHISPFDAFYFISYTATTIGFGEIVEFTTTQRMWVTFSIFLTVVGWAYAIGTMLALVQDRAFQEALAIQSFRRKVRHLREPFLIVAGYGQTGRQVCRELDELGRRFVVIDKNRARIDRLAGDGLHADAPGVEADARFPGVLGLAGLGHPKCAGVLAITDNDKVNLATLMAASLLRPDVPVIVRCDERMIERRMRDFEPMAIINANDRYGGYLVLALTRPTTYRLVAWIMSPEGTPLPTLPEGLTDGRWVVASDDEFGQEVATDLRSAGLDVQVLEPRECYTGFDEMTGISGFVAGAQNDTTNLALAEHARQAGEHLFVCVRQQNSANKSILRALDIDSIFTPTDLIATECLARVVTPGLWQWVEHTLGREEGESAAVLQRVIERSGRRSPDRMVLSINRAQTPALARHLERSDDPVALVDLLRSTDDREKLTSAVLVRWRGDEVSYSPSEEEPVRLGDRYLVVGARQALDSVWQIVSHDAALEYAVSGRSVPDTWLFRAFAGRGNN